MKNDCIYFKIKDEDLTQYHVCLRSGTLYHHEKDSNIMCENCRLWDAYIPITASEIEKQKAIDWQNKPLFEQEDYEEYFRL
jgi:hypothetical protein